MTTSIKSVLQPTHGWTLGINNHWLLHTLKKKSVVYNFFKFPQPFVMTKSHSKLLADMLESHSVHDFCLVGPKVQRELLLHFIFIQVLCV